MNCIVLRYKYRCDAYAYVGCIVTKDLSMLWLNGDINVQGNTNVLAGKKPTDFHQLIMDKKEQQDVELGE